MKSGGMSNPETLSKSFPLCSRSIRGGRKSPRSHSDPAGICSTISAPFTTTGIAHLRANRRCIADYPCRGIAQDFTHPLLYENAIDEMLHFFRDRISLAERAGVPRDAIVLDPGIDVAKQVDG